jgi:hypothetical protein
MKIPFQNQSREQGSALIITLTLGVILLVVLASYLMLLTSQKSLVTRSQTWNAALTMAEAGIEEAMAQINQSNSVSLFTTNVSMPTVTDFSNNGWGKSGSFYGPKSTNLLGGSYSVVITNTLIGTIVSPTIYATGYATVPIVRSTTSRRIKVTTSLQPLFNVGIGAIGSINMNGNSTATDSYNSTLTNLSTLGQYDPNKTSTNGNVASVGGLVDIGNQTILGNLYLGPTASYNNSGTVSGTVVNNYNVQYPDVTLPNGASSWPTAATTSINSTNSKGKVSTVTVYDFTTTGNYILTSDAYPIYVEPGVTATLNVTSTTFAPSDLEIHGGNTNSGTAVMYLNGQTSVGMAGNSAIDASNRPENLWYFGLPTLTSMTFSGTSSFVGVIYAPEVQLTLNGGGNAFGIMGSVIVGSITMHGHYDFHYDEALAKYGPNRGYIATSWQEY